MRPLKIGLLKSQQLESPWNRKSGMVQFSTKFLIIRIPTVATNRILYGKLSAGNSNILYFQPGFHDPSWPLHIFQTGLVQPPTQKRVIPLPNGVIPFRNTLENQRKNNLKVTSPTFFPPFRGSTYDGMDFTTQARSCRWIFHGCLVTASNGKGHSGVVWRRCRLQGYSRYSQLLGP